MLKKLAENIVASRAATVATYSVIGAIALMIGLAANNSTSRLYLVLFGWCLSQIVWTLQMPALMRDMREIDRNRVEAQLNQIFSDALEKFKRAHGMQDDGMPPPDGRPN